MPPRYIKASFFEAMERFKAFGAFTTNGVVKKSGHAVLGRGLALRIANEFPDIPKELGTLILSRGNHVFSLSHRLLSFPVKPIEKILENPSQLVYSMQGKFKIGEKVPGWAVKAELPLIEQSCIELMDIKQATDDCVEEDWESASTFGNIPPPEPTVIVLNYPGIGNGGLFTREVAPILDKYLDEKIIIVYRSDQEQ